MFFHFRFCLPHNLKKEFFFSFFDLKLFILVGCDRSFRLLLGPPGLN